MFIKRYYKSHSAGAGYRFSQDQVQLALNLNYNIAELEDNQTFPTSGTMERTFYSVLPSFFLRYYVSRNNNLRISYTTTDDDPSITQLQNVLNNSNTTQLSIGNPALSQDYEQSFKHLGIFRQITSIQIHFLYFSTQRLFMIILAIRL